MTEFTPLLSLAGGGLIGVAAVLMMALHGRIMGLSGIVAGTVLPKAGDWAWRGAFLLGAVLAPAVLSRLWPVGFDNTVPRLWLVIGGLIVGMGVTFGAGCTSGHGICGNARLQPRSIAATVTFMITAGLTVFVIRHVIGGL
ncbi:MAG TPA: YeeE/YedE family protein [Paenirhodobacter sp.]